VLLVTYECVVGMLVCCRCVIEVCCWCFIGVWGHLQMPQRVVALFGSFTSAKMCCSNYSTSRTGYGRTSLPQPVLCISGCPERVLAVFFMKIAQNVFWALKTLNEQIRSLLLTYIHQPNKVRPLPQWRIPQYIYTEKKVH